MYVVTVLFADDEFSVLTRMFSTEWRARKYMKANFPDLQYTVSSL